MAAMAFTMAGMMNGERVVVLLFISHVLFSLTISLLALSLDILTDSSTSLSQFSTRNYSYSSPSVFSIALVRVRAVALPTVFISKTIQLSLAVSLHQVSIEELESLTIQYWAASASCLCVLIFLCITISCASGNTAPPSRSIRHAKFSLSCIILHNAVCCLTLGTVSLTSFETALKLLWMLSHGLAAVKLIQHVLRTFPSCSSIGEACLVTSGLVLYFGDILAYTIEKVISFLCLGFFMKSEVLHYGMVWLETHHSILCRGCCLAFFSQWPLNLFTECEVRTNNGIWRSVIFFSSLGFIMIVIIPSWMRLVQDFHMHPLLWVLSFIFSEPLKRLSSCAYWICEIIFLIWRLGQSVHKFMNAFTDHSDSDLLIVRNLLVGHYSVKSLSELGNSCPLVFPNWKQGAYASSCHRIRIILCCRFLPAWLIKLHWCSLLLAVTVSGILEAYTAQLDNAFIPLIFYSLLCL
ncbi:unnamed protein product [Malus baccata var. baccata]